MMGIENDALMKHLTQQELNELEKTKININLNEQSERDSEKAIDKML